MEIIFPLPLQFWRDVAEKCQWATFFHTPLWSAAYCETFPKFQDSSIGFITEKGIRAVFPLLFEEKKRFLKTVKHYKSMEPGAYGGIIAEAELEQEDIDSIIKHVTGLKNSKGRITGNPFKPFQMPSFLIKKEMETSVINLSSGFESVWKKFSRGQKSNIKQAQKKSLSVREASSEKDIISYYLIYEDTLKRWGEKTRISFPEKLFQNLFKRKSPDIGFWIAEKEQEAVAGILALRWHDKLIFWHGCSKQENFSDYPNNLLHFKAMKWACENNIKFYDMGSSMGIEGLLKFKKSFGAELRKYYAYRWK